MVTSRIVETGIIQSNHKDSSKTKRVTFLKREVMPYAKRRKKSPSVWTPSGTPSITACSRHLTNCMTKSKAGEVFNGLMELVLSPDNIMLAYRNIKPTQAATQQEQISRISVTLDGFHRLRSSVRSEKLSQAANTATVPNQCAGRTSQSQTENQAAGYSLHLGQIGATVHQTNPGTHL